MILLTLVLFCILVMSYVPRFSSTTVTTEQVSQQEEGNALIYDERILHYWSQVVEEVKALKNLLPSEIQDQKARSS